MNELLLGWCLNLSDACEGFRFTTLLYLNFCTNHIQTVKQFILPFGVKSQARYTTNWKLVPLLDSLQANANSYIFCYICWLKFVFNDLFLNPVNNYWGYCPWNALVSQLRLKVLFLRKADFWVCTDALVFPAHRKRMLWDGGQHIPQSQRIVIRDCRSGQLPFQVWQYLTSWEWDSKIIFLWNGTF